MKTLILAAVVLSVTDGDTLRARIPAWAETPFEVMGLRIAGIDTPESVRSRAKCPDEVEKGLAAKRVARTMLEPGQTIKFRFVGLDKYGGRILAAVTLPSGEDFATVMIAAGHARPYDGKTKGSWCP
jgi:micrococcal nuclease